MRNLLISGAIFVACATPAAFAQDAVTVTGNVALATDYTFLSLIHI